MVLLACVGPRPWAPAQKKRHGSIIPIVWIDYFFFTSGGVKLRETSPLLSAGATGDIELALQNVEWRREINLSWLEFSRWGIQQLILISRLQYIKHPWIQRGINVAANYVFGRGVEVKAEFLLKFFHHPGRGQPVMLPVCLVS